LLVFQGLAELAVTLARDFAAALVKVLAGPAAVYDSGVLLVADPAALVRGLSHVCAVLRLREMVRPFADEPKVAPHADADLCGKVTAKPIQELIENPAAVDLFAALFANTYWEAFDYDVGHDAAKDNTHLWARFFDFFVGTAMTLKIRVTPDLFYRQLFLKSLASINKAREHFAKNKKIQYPGLDLIILIDHIVRESQYADYSQLELYVSYHFIRSLYTARLSRIGAQ
jgi:hypothetical protein